MVKKSLGDLSECLRDSGFYALAQQTWVASRLSWERLGEPRLAQFRHHLVGFKFTHVHRVKQAIALQHEITSTRTIYAIARELSAMLVTYLCELRKVLVPTEEIDALIEDILEEMAIL